MTFTRTEEFEVSENVLEEMVKYTIRYIDKGVDVREAVYCAYIKHIKELPNGISAVYEKLEAELVDRIVEHLCEREFGEED